MRNYIKEGEKRRKDTHRVRTVCDWTEEPRLEAEVLERRKSIIAGAVKGAKAVIHHRSCRSSSEVSGNQLEKLDIREGLRFRLSRDLVLGIFSFLFAIPVTIVCKIMDLSFNSCFLFRMAFTG